MIAERETRANSGTRDQADRDNRSPLTDPGDGENRDCHQDHGKGEHRVKTQRLIIVSNQPPKYPAMSPSGMPISVAMPDRDQGDA